MATENLKIRVTSDSSQAKRDMGGFDDKMKSTIKSVASLAVAMIALKKTYDFFAQATKMAMEQEKIFNTLKNTVKLTGEAWGDAKWELDRLFASLQETTVYGDTETAAVFQKLTLLTGDYKTAMEGLPLVLDMAASGFFDINSSARYVGLALTGNIEMLGRYFSEFKAANNEQLKSMDASEKAAYALDILKTKLKGLAAGELNTSVGAWTQFKNYWGDVQEAIGDKFIGTLGDLSRSGTATLQDITKLLRLQDIQLHETGGAFESMSKTAQLALKQEKLALLEHQMELEKHPTLWYAIGRAADSVLEAVEHVGRGAKETVNSLADVPSAISYMFQAVAGGENVIDVIKNFDTGFVEFKKAIDETDQSAIDFANTILMGTNKFNELAAEAEKTKKEIAALGDELNNIGLENIPKKIEETETSIRSIVSYLGKISGFKMPDFSLDTKTDDIDIASFYEQYLQTEKEKVTEQYEWKLQQLLKFNEEVDGIRTISDENYYKYKKQLDGEYQEWLKNNNTDSSEEQVKQISQIWNTFGNTASSMLQTVFKSGFDNIGDMFEDLIHRMIADLIVSGILQIITQGASTGFGFFAGLFGGHSGLEISNVAGKPVKGASGLDFTVPQGFPNDSFPILVESGEHVSVTPSGQGSRTDELLEKVLNAINKKPVANTVLFDDVGMSRYVDRGKLKRENG